MLTLAPTPPLTPAPTPPLTPAHTSLAPEPLQVLTTKDGFCDTLRSLHLPLGELWPFTFPCWILPRDLAPLTQRLQEAAEAPEPDGGANAPPATPAMTAAVGAVGAVG